MRQMVEGKLAPVDGGEKGNRDWDLDSTTIHAKPAVGIPWPAGWLMRRGHAGENSRRKVQNVVTDSSANRAASREGHSTSQSPISSPKQPGTAKVPA